jgi:tetratricopeptide (TPR) repeat protein
MIGVIDMDNGVIDSQQLTAAYKLCREGRLLELSTMPLAHSPLVEQCFLQGVPVNPDVRGRTLQSVLRWAVMRLRPGGEHSWVAYQWRHYNTVAYFYFESMRVSELAERMAIAEQTLYQVRASAMEAIGRTLEAELTSPRDLAGRRHLAISDRYGLFSTDQQRILRLLAAFQQGMPVKLLHTLTAHPLPTDVQAEIHQLLASNWVVTNERGSELLLRPEVSDYLRTRLTPQERSDWHSHIGDYFTQREQYFSAAQHYFSADLVQKAARILIDHYATIVNDLQVDEMLNLISEFHRTDMDSATWAQLKIVAGDGAYLLEDVDTALAEYQQALRTPEIDVKALAYYRRAKVLELRNTDEALAHYAYCIQLLVTQPTPAPLLVRVYIDRAILLLEKRNNPTQATGDLENAAAIITPHARGDWADLHTAWLTIDIRRAEFASAIEHGQQAWLAANEIGDVIRMMHSAHNLGMLYARLSRFEEGLSYLGRSFELATEVGNRQMAGASSKTIGGNLYMIGRFAEAEKRYQEAYAIFVELGNHSWQAHTCFDLAEVYAEMGDMQRMYHYFEEGITLARDAGDVRLVEAFEKFGRSHQSLFSDLNPRQLQGLNHIKAHGKITNRQYQEINALSARQALRDLQALEAAEIVVKVGKGRATYYQMTRPD